MADDGGMLPGLCQHLTLTILDDSADAGLRMIKTIRYYLDTWGAFLEDRQKLVDHLHGAHHADRACAAADSASLDRRHREAHAATWRASWAPTRSRRDNRPPRAAIQPGVLAVDLRGRGDRRAPTCVNDQAEAAGSVAIR
jgi:hypothetical protein